MKIIKIKPHFSEKIWGSKDWKSLGYENPSNKKFGEAWVISAHPNGLSFLDDEEITLKDFFQNNKNFFGRESYEKFPLLSKVINPTENLSVQVHPNDEYAIKNENDLGKPESWIVLDCPKDSEIIYGHSAQNKEEFIECVENNNWKKLLKTIKVNKGDFIFVPSGKIHALTANVKVFELQRSSDVTYRLYDYDRLEEGKKRELQIEKSIDNLTFPDNKLNVVKNASGRVFSSNFFSIFVYKSTLHTNFVKYEDSYWIELTVVKGEGTIGGVKFQKGESAIILSNFSEIIIEGEIEIIFYWIKK
ncbi:mannose-6-phosphate isomerase [Mesoplasma chauliocola]|uniref:Mannose-6-phosphate isomerase n=1 Tax=Mesoplasma chauliocola TaxID=216427 RepID=A0A249SP90_9MOLU|nr:type I phosphomannose isomerase catalytic subunit [Mesoplasma chauliocola]ASZ09413.1 mannose-6-phosphate isomerase [Mesoplasma chauliocola]